MPDPARHPARRRGPHRGSPDRGDGDKAKSRFCPPEAIARDEPYVLFLDELNGAGHEVQKAFYSLILDRRLGNYELHPQSVVIGAGNRARTRRTRCSRRLRAGSGGIAAAKTTGARRRAGPW